MPAPARAQVEPIQGDVNDDGFVGIADLNLILGYWNQNVPPADPRADPSGDGFVGIEDLNLVLANWNKGYWTRQSFKGMNLHWVKRWSREWAFVDIVKTMDRWRATNPNGQPFEISGVVVVTDVNGWPILGPGQGAHALFYQESEAVSGHYPTGTYDVTFDVEVSNEDPLNPLDWDEDLVISSTFDAGNNIKVATPPWIAGPAGSNLKTSSGHWSFHVNTTSKNGILSLFANKHPTATVRFHNIKITMPGYKDAASPFHPLFIKRLRPFSVIRFMDWQRTNTVDDVSWGARPTKDYFSQGTDKGVALEYMIALCNELQASPWFCMPHKADNNPLGYVESFATMVRDGDPANNIPPLHANAKIYVEWSNEVWNNRSGTTDVFDWVKSQAGGFSFGSDQYYDKWADEVAMDFKDWYDLFAATNQEHRLIRVAAGQAANVDVTEKLTRRLKFRTDYAEQFDAISCAAYFGDEGYTGPSSDGAALINYAMDTQMGTIVESEGYYMDHGTAPGGLAHTLSGQMGRTIDLLAYEAGQHMTPKNASQQLKSYSSAVIEAQTLPQMYEAYFKNMQSFKDAGGTLYVAFNYINKQDDIDGGWGHLDHQDQPLDEAHKLRAVLDFPNHE